jgi:hypothetical protein
MRLFGISFVMLLLVLIVACAGRPTECHTALRPINIKPSGEVAK